MQAKQEVEQRLKVIAEAKNDCKELQVQVSERVHPTLQPIAEKGLRPLPECKADIESLKVRVNYH